MPNIPKNKFSPFWILVILLLIIAGVLVLFRDVLPIGDEPAQQPPPPSTEWTTAGNTHSRSRAGRRRRAGNGFW